MTQPETRDWGGFGAILNEAKALEESLRQQDQTDCPVCGLTLDVRDDGAVNCRMGHFRAAQMPKEIP